MASTALDYNKVQLDPGYILMKMHFVFAVKHDGRRKSRLVTGGHLTGTPVESVYSGVVVSLWIPDERRTSLSRRLEQLILPFLLYVCFLLRRNQRSALEDYQVTGLPDTVLFWARSNLNTPPHLTVERIATVLTLMIKPLLLPILVLVFN